MDGFSFSSGDTAAADQRRKNALSKRKWRAAHPETELHARIGTARNLLLRNGWTLIDKHGKVYTLKDIEKGSK